MLTRVAKKVMHTIQFSMNKQNYCQIMIYIRKMDNLQIKIEIAAITQTESSIYFKFFDHICDKCKT